MTPLRLIPVSKDYIWGGNRLITEYGKKSDSGKAAESWELSCHPDGESRVSGGVYDGMTLSETLEKLGAAALGSRGAGFPMFPILTKLIDAQQNLSVQVHPDDAYALRVEGEYGKTELWYVVDCKEGAYLYFGFDRELSKEEFSRHIQEGTLEEVVNKVPVKKGDVFFIEAGTLHAIGAGILIAEIQQNSNITYRVYDYGRLGADGNPRPLHVDKALDVTDLRPSERRSPMTPREYPGGTVTCLAACPYFTVEAISLRGKLTERCGCDSFRHLLVLEGEGDLTWEEGGMTFSKGDSFFLPAGLGEYALTGEGKLLCSFV